MAAGAPGDPPPSSSSSPTDRRRRLQAQPAAVAVGRTAPPPRPSLLLGGSERCHQHPRPQKAVMAPKGVPNKPKGGRIAGIVLTSPL